MRNIIITYIKKKSTILYFDEYLTSCFCFHLKCNDKYSNNLLGRIKQLVCELIFIVCKLVFFLGFLFLFIPHTVFENTNHKYNKKT